MMQDRLEGGLNTVSGKFALFCCENSAGLAVETVSPDLLSSFEIVSLPCSGRIATTLLLKTLERGFPGAIVLGCPEENCTYVSGNKRAAKHVAEARRAIENAGLDPVSIEMDYVSSVDTHKVEMIMRELITKYRLGKRPGEQPVGQPGEEERG